jgi:Family of unknown function (DUF6104)
LDFWRIQFRTIALREERRRHQHSRGVREPSLGTKVYFTDRGIEELQARRGEDEVTLAWLADQLRTFVDLHPEFETPVERFATWLARLDDANE